MIQLKKRHRGKALLFIPWRQFIIFIEGIVIRIEIWVKILFSIWTDIIVIISHALECILYEKEMVNICYECIQK
jgi:hypothetical protein